MNNKNDSALTGGGLSLSAAASTNDPPQAAGEKRFPPVPNDDSLTPPMLIGMIARMQQNLMRNTETTGSVMSKNSCRVLIKCLAWEEGLSQLELSRRTRLKPPTVSVALGRLEREGYVRREVSQSDGREVRVYLTDAGRQLEDSTRARVRAAEDISMRDITPGESEVLRSLLLKMKNSLAENENSADPRDKSADAPVNTTQYKGTIHSV